MPKTRANEPAFPRPIGNSGAADFPDREVNPDQEGVTTREYFIAHAPAEPWAWFTPTMPPEPKPPKNAGDPTWEFDEHEIRQAEGWRKDPCFDLTGSPRLDRFKECWEAFGEARNQHQEETKRQRCVQWPIFWANTIISQLDKEGGP